MKQIIRLILFLLSLACFTAAGYLTWQESQRYEAIRSLLPAGSTIAGIPVGGLTTQDAAQRLAQTYLLTPVQIKYQNTSINIYPQNIGFTIDLNSMLAEASQDNQSSLVEYLQDHHPASFHIPLKSSLDTAKLRAFLDDIKPRYGSSPVAPRAVLTGEYFLPGKNGEGMNPDPSIDAISKAFTSLTNRVVEVGSEPQSAPPPSFDQLNPLLSTLIQTSGFEGTIEVYLQDAQSGKEINIAYANGKPIPPGIAFTAASTIKIPVLISAFRHVTQLSPTLQKRMELMIDLSDNGSTDEVMTSTMDQNLAPLEVTQDMKALGLQNTFLAGLFYPGAPLLQRIETPDNSRSDISTDPDPYNQTTPAEMGRLLAWIDSCASNNSGPLVTTFTGQITQSECQSMLTMLKNNRKAVLIEAGLPEGAVMGHKYGWVTDPSDGLMHTLSDAAIVYTPGGNYILSVYVYDSKQLLWDSAQSMIAYLAIAVEHYYGLLATSE